jgi:adenosylcobinamide kinase/adenosylcobinamide-phosphate guanylyltransferase
MLYARRTGGPRRAVGTTPREKSPGCTENVMHSTLFVGGCRSGKSGLALRRAEALAARRTFIATARLADEAMRERAARHKAQRGPGWNCVEAPFEPLAAAREAANEAGVLLLDCIGFWLCNLMEREADDGRILERARELALWLHAPPVPVLVVTHESGCGVAPATALGNRFRDLNGEANQILAQSCRDVILVACGLPLPLKGAL